MATVTGKEQADVRNKLIPVAHSDTGRCVRLAHLNNPDDAQDCAQHLHG